MISFRDSDFSSPPINVVLGSWKTVSRSCGIEPVIKVSILLHNTKQDFFYLGIEFLKCRKNRNIE